PDNYYVVRANALENNVNFYRVANGRRQETTGANVKVAPDAAGLGAIGPGKWLSVLRPIGDVRPQPFALMCVAVPVMQVRIVRVLVNHRLVSMQVHVWFANRVPGRMFVLMVFVVDMAMRMLERPVNVFVFMPLREMKIETDAHQE